MIILSSPSGAGKTTISKIQQKFSNFKISISHTTRKPRANEVDSVDYFLSLKMNLKKIKNNEFYEFAKILIIITNLKEISE